jgi:hypothetical protein
MKTMSRVSRRPQTPADPQMLQDAILMLESRLRSLGDGDCGYEKAMIRFYEQQLGLYRARLSLHLGAAVSLEAVSPGVSGTA